MKKMWVLYSCTEMNEKDEAVVLESFDEREGKPCKKYVMEMYGFPSILVEYDVDESTTPPTLINPKAVAPRVTSRRKRCRKKK